MITTVIQKIRAKPLFCIKRLANPLWWVKRLFCYFAMRKPIKEANNVLLLLTRMHEGQSQDLLAYRNHKLSEMLEYAYQHCRFYRNLFEKFDIDPHELCTFKRLPPLDKATVRNCRDDIISDEIDHLHFYTQNTGGSTGEPLEFPVSNSAGKHVGAHQEFLYKMIGYKQGDKIVGFDGSSVPEYLRRNRIYWVKSGIKEIPWGRLAYSSLYLTQETLPLYIRHIFDYRPSILRGYPSFINDVAGHILKNNISIPFYIKGIVLTAENAYDWQIKNIKKAFCTNVFLEYGQSEMTVFGYTADDTYEYRCSPFYGLTEVLDPEGKQVKEGETGEIVTTSFNNNAFPLIRYRTGDIAVFNGDENGIVRLGKITGRTQDYVYTNNRERVALTALVFGQHYHAFRNIQKWQLMQSVPGKVVIKIVKGEDFAGKDEEEIRSKFKSICNIDTDFELVDSIPLTRTGKFKFIVQNIKL